MRNYGLIVGMIAVLSGCPWRDHGFDRHSHPSKPRPPAEGPFECTEDIPAEAFLNCTCEGVVGESGPGDACVEPVVLYERICLIDSSCNAYEMDVESSDVLAPNTDRDDVAIRWEWAQPLPLDADLSLNMPEPDDPTLTRSPLSLMALDLSGVEDPVVDADNFPFPGPNAWIDGEVFVDADRRGFTIVPKQRCFSGTWLLRTEMDLEQIYGEIVCDSGVPDILIGGYAANFALE
jgi:hypothetical protein